MRKSGVCTEAQQEVVILTQILGDEINIGYTDYYNESVIAVNGRLPRDMVDFARLLDQAEGVVDIRTSGPGRIMLDSAEVKATEQQIMARYHVTSDRSADLRP